MVSCLMVRIWIAVAAISNGNFLSIRSFEDNVLYLCADCTTLFERWAESKAHTFLQHRGFYIYQRVITRSGLSLKFMRNVKALL